MDEGRRFQLRFVGADAIMLYFDGGMSPATNAEVRQAAEVIDATLGPCIIELVPAYASLLVVYDPLQVTHIHLASQLREALSKRANSESAGGREVSLPVYYAAEAGADLETLARSTGLAVEEVIALHSGRVYQVYAIGFAPGFAYLGEVDERIAQPRLDTPRAQVPKGSVAIAERQTAVYPSISPGGWNLIGMCPTRMFDPSADPAVPLSVGDTVRFNAITKAEFLDLGGELR